MERKNLLLKGIPQPGFAADQVLVLERPEQYTVGSFSGYFFLNFD